MTRLCLLAAVLGVALSCGHAAPPPVVNLTPVQVPSGPAVKADGQNYVLVIYGTNYAVLSVVGGTFSVVPIAQVVNLNGPGPTPPPGPGPGPTPLNTRAAKYRDLALVATDPDRAATARKLAAAYAAVASGTYDNLDRMADAAIAARSGIINDTNWATLWQSFRLELTNEWTAVRQNGTTLPAAAELFKDLSAGLNASTQ